MIVSDIIKIDNRRQKIVLEDGFSFPLYNAEIKRFNIEAGQNISDQLLNNISEEILYPRAKDRALYLIGNRDRTKKQLRDKLNDSYYPEDIIRRVIEFLERYNYVDDRRFAEDYIRIKSKSKSRRQIHGELLQKGISLDDIKELLYVNDASTEKDAILKWLSKSKYKDMLDDSVIRNKAITSLLRKGFEYDKITRCIEEISRY